MSELPLILRIKASTWERVGETHPSFRDAALVKVLRDAADEIERLNAKLDDCTNRYCNLLDQLGAGVDM